MSYHQPPYGGYPPSWQPPYQHVPHQVQHQAPHQDSLALGTTLGQLLAGQERSIFLHEAQLHELRALPARIAEMIPQPAAKPPEPTIHERLSIVREILKTLVPLALLAAIVMGKLTFIEAWPLLRQSMGLGG